MAITYSLDTTPQDADYIFEHSQNIPELTPRSQAQLRKLSKAHRIAVAREGQKIIGWVISEPLAGNVYELGLGFVEEPYRGNGILYKMLELLIADGKSTYVFATFEQRILHSMKKRLGFEQSSLWQVTFVSRGKFLTKRLSSRAATKRVAKHLSGGNALYGIKKANTP